MESQPILQIMLQKASQAREHYRQRRAPVVTETQPDDELAIFGGRTRLVSTLPSLALPSSKAKSNARTIQQPLRPACPTEQQFSLDGVLHQNSPLADRHLGNLQATFADLSGGWDGLFHEVPQPSHGFPGNPGSPYPAAGLGEGVMLDDRWSSFMHHYSILAEPTQPQHPHSQLPSQ
ncbi:hypothetical protein FPV67DRAFT_26495 [Lyophyllum atratum]|nr:hypothetical protein FPV67DRAFT_26495 [Lyophyllum atratum]